MKIPSKMRTALSCLLCAFLGLSQAFGSNPPLLNGKIIGGIPVQRDIMQFIASLKVDMMHVCGGCLISSVHVLTAGQCIYAIQVSGGENFEKISILLGSYIIIGHGIKRKVKNAEYHPAFKPPNALKTCAFDIGLILLDEDIGDTNLLRPISYSKLNIIHGLVSEVVGYGSDKIENPHMPLNDSYKSVVLRRILVKMAGYKVCNESYPDLLIDKKRHVCGYTYGDNTTSKGDVGSPLVSENKLLGITTQISKSEPTRIPSLFIKVSTFKHYIEEAKIRLIENQDRQANKRSREGCLRSSNKRLKIENLD